MTLPQRVASTKIPHPSQTSWPELPLDAWRETLETVHRWMQVIGKIKLALTPLRNHWWNVAHEPAGYGKASISTPGAFYHEQLHGYYLHHDELRRAQDPEGLLLDFCQQTYEAAADLARWNRAELERA